MSSNAPRGFLATNSVLENLYLCFYEKKKYSPQIATSFELIEEDPLMAKQPSYLQDRLSALK